MPSILIIDDEKTVLEMIKHTLMKFGHTVCTAESARKGLEAFKKGSFDLVIADIMMPELEGGHVARHIRSAARAAVPIIGISSTPWLPDRDPFDAVLSKPFPVESLVEQVRECLRRRA
jgi:two-component system phosphate regulon response regulator PhoB